MRIQAVDEQNVAWADLCVDVVEDALRAVRSAAIKFRHATRHIGPDRLEEVLITMRALEMRDMPSELMREMLVVKREAAYTLTAIRHRAANREPPDNRIEKAEGRAAAVQAALSKLQAQRQVFRRAVGLE